jgi:hypothetical protein
MIEIRTFDGDVDELARFCTSSWRKRYSGRMPVPDWRSDFLEWELLGEDHAAREFLVAAYDGGRLVGALPARPARFQLRGRPVAGTWGSFFAVDDDYENQGVSLKLNLEQRRRHRDRGAQVFTGYVYLGSSASMGKEFWLRQRSVKILGKVGLWARLFDHRAVSDFEFSTRDKWATRALGWFQGRPRPPRDASAIRPYRPADLNDCLQLVARLSHSADFGYEWNEAALARRLQYGDVPRTFVADVDGRVSGFLNYCHLDLMGRRTITAGVIDLLSIDGLSPAMQQNLLRTAMCRMAEEGCHLALLLRLAGYPTRPLLTAGFIAQPPEYYYVAQTMGTDLFDTPVKSLHIHWR